MVLFQGDSVNAQVVSSGWLPNYPLQRGSFKFDGHSSLAECFKRRHAGYPEPNFLLAA